MNTTDWLKFAAWFGAETGVVIGIAALLHSALRSARTRRAVWQGAFTALLLVSLVEIFGLRVRLPQPGFKMSAAYNVVSSTTTIQPVAPVVRASSSTAPAQAEEPRPALVKWPVLLWLTGVLLLFGRLLLGRFCLRIRRRSALPSGFDSLQKLDALRQPLGLGSIRCEIWPSLHCPVAFGIFRPAVALPPDFGSRFSPAEQQVMLAHELAHLQARDPLWALASDLALALVWWQPLAWWARRQLDATTESAADEASALVPDGPHALAECLVRLGREMTAGLPTRVLGIGGSGPRSSLAFRVRHLLGNSPSWRHPAAWSRLAAPAIALFIAFVSTLLPIQARTNDSLFTILAARTDSASFNVATVPAPANPSAQEKLFAQADHAVTSFPTNSGSTNRPTILLKTQLISLPVSSKPQLGLDWLFGQSPTNNPAVEISHDWNQLLPLLTSKKGDSNFLANCGLRSPWLTNLNNLTIERLRTVGQSAVLSAEQYRALLSAIEQQDDTEILGAPNIATASGLEARIEIGGLQGVVSGLNVEISGGKTLKATLSTVSNSPAGMDFVDLTPVLEPDGRWRLPVQVGIQEFLGYLKSPNKPSVDLGIPSDKTISVVIPWPNFRFVESSAEATLAIGQTLAIRGPEWTPSEKVQGSKTKNAHRRLYVFITAAGSPTSLP